MCNSKEGAKALTVAGNKVGKEQTGRILPLFFQKEPRVEAVSRSLDFYSVAYLLETLKCTVWLGSEA